MLFHKPCKKALLSLAFIVAMLIALPSTAQANEGDVVYGMPASHLSLAAEQLPALDAVNVALIDEEGTLWFGRAASETAQIASLTKIMTALVAADHLNAQDFITVTPEAASVGESSAGLLPGDTMTFDMALKALLTASGNDAALAIAEAAGANLLTEQEADGGALACEAAFVDAMNAKAAELGLEHSYFTNPHGLDFDAFAQGQYSCALDVAKMLRAAMQNDLIRANIGYSQVNCVVDRGGTPVELPLSNTDTMLQNYTGTCAAKTGFTAAAGPCVATAVTRNDGHEYYAVVLGSSSKPQRFIDSVALYDWVYANRTPLEEAASTLDEEADQTAPTPPTERYQLVASPSSLHTTINGVEDSYPVVARVTHLGWPNQTFAATVAEPGKTVETPEEAGRIEQTVVFAEADGDVRRGDVVGHLTFTQDGIVLWEADLLAAEDVNAPTWWEGLGVALERFFGGFTGTPTTAENTLLNPGAMKVS